MEKEVLMIDQDDVISEGGLLYCINTFLGTNYQNKDFKNFYMQDVIPKELQKQFWQWFIKQNIYEHTTLLPYAREVLEELNKKYQLYIVTSFIFPEIAWQSGYVVAQKMDYFNKELPFINPYQLMFLWDKKYLQADIKIDDKKSHLIGAKRKILFTAYHNMDIPCATLKNEGVERADDWEDIKIKLLK